MSRFTTFATMAALLALAPAANAQARGRAMGPPTGGPGAPPAGVAGIMPGMNVASTLLAQTGELKLTDQQVTRLAAIARRVTDRRTAMMAGADSLRAKRMASPPAAGGAPSQPPAEARAMMTRMREQSHTDLRDAIAILTPDQQATAWEMMARRSGAGRMRPMGGGFGGRRAGGMRRTMDGGQGGPRPNPMRAPGDGQPRPRQAPPGAAPGGPPAQ